MLGSLSAEPTATIRQTPNNTGFLRAAVWGKDRFVVAELSGTIPTRWDGVTWTDAGFTGADSFQVTFTDARSATVPGTIQVTAQPSIITPPGPVSIVFTGGQAAFLFQGNPGQTYHIERSVTLVHRVPFTTATATPNRAVTFTHPTPPPGKAFYRIMRLEGATGVLDLPRWRYSIEAFLCYCAPPQI
jgi:hypothetical protein